MRYLRLFLILTALLVTAHLAGCASVVSGVTQNIAIDTSSGGDQLVEASCELTNSFGHWTATTPAQVSVHRASDSLLINCSKEGYFAANAILPSSLQPALAGNILIGGVIGGGVDLISGAAYQYDKRIQIAMKRDSSQPLNDKNTTPLSSTDGQSPAAVQTALPTNSSGSAAKDNRTSVAGGLRETSVAVDNEFVVAKKKCAELGFAEGTEKFGQCVLSLSK